MTGQDLPHQRPDDLQVGDVDVAAADLLGDHAGGQPIGVLAAETGRELRGDQAEAADLAAQLRLDPPVALAGLIARQEPVLREGAGPVAVPALGAGELEIHGGPASAR